MLTRKQPNGCLLINPKPNLKIQKETHLPHSPEKVWQAITETKALNEWMMHNDFKAVVGYKFHFRSSDTDLIMGQVLEVEPAKKLVYSWNKDNKPRTIVSWFLTETPSGTLLQLEHDGFPEAEEKFFESHNKGWSFLIERLPAYLAQ